MKYSVKMGSGFTKTGSGIQKLIGGIHVQTRTHRQQGDLISLLLFFEIEGSRLHINLT
jgi:hypothetical protein